MRRRGADVLFAVLVTAAIGVAVLAVLVWNGVLVDDDQNATQLTTHLRPLPPPPRTTTQTTQTTATEPVSTPARPQPARVVIVATRGRCWVYASRDSTTGPVLLARTLDQGERVTLTSRKMVLQLGASNNVDLTVNGEPRPIPYGAASVTVG